MSNMLRLDFFSEFSLEYDFRIENMVKRVVSYGKYDTKQLKSSLTLL